MRTCWIWGVYLWIGPPPIKPHSIASITHSMTHWLKAVSLKVSISLSSSSYLLLKDLLVSGLFPLIVQWLVTLIDCQCHHCFTEWLYRHCSIISSLHSHLFHSNPLFLLLLIIWSLTFQSYPLFFPFRLSFYPSLTPSLQLIASTLTLPFMPIFIIVTLHYFIHHFHLKPFIFNL